MMATYGTLENLEGSDMQLRYKGSGGEVVTRQFNYCEVFGNHFRYRHQVDNNNNNCHYPISEERTWAPKYCPDRCHAYFLALAEVNVNYLQRYLVDGAGANP